MGWPFVHRRLWRLGKTLTYAVLGFWSVVCLFPIYWFAVTSFKSELDVLIAPHYLPFVDFKPKLDAWVFIFTDREDNLGSRYLNSALIALVSTVLTVLFGAMATYGLSRFRSSRLLSDGVLRTAILASRVLPPVVIVIPLYVMAQTTGMLDTRLALITTYTAANPPVVVRLLQPVFGDSASELEDAARLEGASHWDIFSTIVLPAAASGLAAVAPLDFVLCWNEYLFASVLVSDHALTVPPWVVGQISMKEAQIIGEGEEWARLSVAILLTVAPPLVIAVLAQRFAGRMRWLKR